MADDFTRYSLRWHRPLAPDQSAGIRPGDWVAGGADGDDAQRLRHMVTRRRWPAGTVFEVTRHIASGERKALCYYEQIAEWRPDRRVLPRALPIQVPMSRSLKVAQVMARLASLLQFATKEGLCSDNDARALQRHCARVLAGPDK